jgi:hypothetical protein
MRDPNAYTMLISGLPRPEALFRAKRPPLSRLKLERRLRVLAPEDADLLKTVEQVLTWRHLPISLSDAEIVNRVPDMQVRRRRVESSLDAQRAPLGQFLTQGILHENLLCSAANDLKRVVYFPHFTNPWLQISA